MATTTDRGCPVDPIERNSREGTVTVVMGACYFVAIISSVMATNALMHGAMSVTTAAQVIITIAVLTLPAEYMKRRHEKWLRAQGCPGGDCKHDGGE